MNTAGGRRSQWIRLLALTAAHFVLDMFPGLMHTILPAVQDTFALTLAAGGLLLTLFLVAANGIQVVIGHLRQDNNRPVFLYAGLVLTCTILLFGAVQPQTMPLVWLSVIAMACGAGVGMTHPESLRAVHRLEGISSSVSSAVFMGGGVLGFAFGSVAGAYLYGRFGFAGLLPFCSASILAAIGLAAMGIRLAVEPDSAQQSANGAPRPGSVAMSFWTVLLMATLLVCSVQILLWIVPQHISAIGADLTYGGKTVSLFTLSGGIGGMALAGRAARYGELKTIFVMLATGIPFVAGYVWRPTWPASLVLLGIGGFFCFGAYPMMVSMARHSKGSNLGRRMGLVVGGVWLIACLLPMALGPAAERFGTGAVMMLTPIGFITALGLAGANIRKHKLNRSSETLVASCLLSRTENHD